MKRRKKESKTLVNVAGELEQDMFSRKANFIEAVLMMSLLQIIMWGVWFPLDIMGKDPLVSYIILGCLALFMFTSPIIHRDTLKGWGMGDPRYIIKSIKEGGNTRVKILIPVITLPVVAGIAFVLFWADLADALDLGTDVIDWQDSIGGKIGIFGIGAAMGFLLIFFVIRLDNFLNALKVALLVIAILGSSLFLLIIAFDPDAFVDFDVGGFFLNFLGYIFWGALQQFLFAGYFGTRFRKGFTPAIESPAEGEEKKLWKKRAIVAIISGSYFGLIHVPAWALLGFTTILGIILSWFFMKDQNRNLFALGIIHGFLGSMVADAMDIEMSVGPSSVPSQLVPYFWIVGIFLALQQIGIMLAWYFMEKRE
ncbi:hypothetical protein GF325_14440 [Candidatus Bathyarchaeota archaeon]|nr:hypothetical protein [Candidatus Bathyarchaeota archaeon]